MLSFQFPLCLPGTLRKMCWEVWGWSSDFLGISWTTNMLCIQPIISGHCRIGFTEMGSRVISSLFRLRLKNEVYKSQHCNWLWKCLTLKKEKYRVGHMYCVERRRNTTHVCYGETSPENVEPSFKSYLVAFSLTLLKGAPDFSEEITKAKIILALETLEQVRILFPFYPLWFAQAYAEWL